MSAYEHLEDVNAINANQIHLTANARVQGSGGRDILRRNGGSASVAVKRLLVCVLEI